MKLSLLACIITSAMLLITSCSSTTSKAKNTDDKQLAYSYLKKLASPTEGIGAREAGTEAEKRTADFIEEQFRHWGYRVTLQNFSFKRKEQSGESKNIIAELGNPENPTIILAAHYDSTAMKSGSMGATDNGAGVAAMLTIAQQLMNKIPENYNIRFIAFGAEEIGLKGSNYYVKHLVTHKNIGNIAAMINFDTIAGGDNVYVHSAHSTPYKRCNTGNYNSDVSIRDALLSASTQILGKTNQYKIHPDYAGYPAGETGSWSDHASFACAGIPIAYVESTNFAIDGKNGNDGYSQSINPELWQCYDKESKSACNRKTEKKWGEIWHTEFDTLENMEKLFPGRIEKQLTDNVKVLVELLSSPDLYLKEKMK
jgi:hypothetical protein